MNYTHLTPIEIIIEENERRNRALAAPYDPITGIGCYGSRTAIERAGTTLMVPNTMLPHITAQMSDVQFDLLRFAHDFEYWCVRCIVVKDKITCRDTPLRLNAPQRRMLAMLEDMRLARQPIRLIVLKARQWGGSTLSQVYMAWMQIIHHTHCNSIICGHLRDTASTIQGIYNRLLGCYPQQYQAGNEPMKFRPFQKSRNISEITGRQCLVAATTAMSPESVRGMDIAMAHLTEVAFWPTSARRSPESLIRSVCGSIMLQPDTLLIMESTANGMGNYFHSEWLRAKTGFSDKQALFVPWFEIEIYRKPVKDAAKLWQQLDDYELMLWQLGCTLEMIAWYHHKRKEYNSHSHMQAEYPTNDIEAFANSGMPVFNAAHLEQLRRHCSLPATMCSFTVPPTGAHALNNVTLLPNNDAGDIRVWRMPDAATEPRMRYVVAVDVGGLSDKADFSVITVIDRLAPHHKMEIVAEWRGHTYHDRLAWLAAQLAKYYNNALLVIESNTLEMEYSEGDGSQYVLNTLRHHYRNIYRRRGDRPGFHTNRETKTEAIFHLIGLVRDGAYIEHSDGAVNELAWYEHKPRGGFGAIMGRHDDMVMTRAIGMLVASRMARTNAIMPTLSDVI
ncbi:MAG: hypothetical protein ACI308_11625 [Muribaculaceae bacterium]